MNYNAIQLLKSCGLIAALSASAVAQGTAGPDIATQPETGSVMARSFSMHFVSGALRAGGPGYKARFDRDGMEYTPALGDAAPRNLPVHFRLKSIRRGQHVLFEAAAGNAVAPRQQGMVASYDRGNDIVETYEARVDGVKQNFTFQTVPMGSGDLVVECELQTELQSVRGTSDQGFSLEMPGVGGVTIGQVIGLDAFNSRVTGSMSCDGATLQLVLPDSFVSQAAYPMVLDPVIGTVVAVNVNPAKDADVAGYGSSFLVVWEHQFSQLDTDIRCQAIDVQGALIGTGGLVAQTTMPEINPSVACIREDANYPFGSSLIVAWQEGPTIVGPWHIKAVRSRSDGAYGTPIDVTPPGSGSITPDVSGYNDWFSPIQPCIIAYEQAGAIYAAQVTSTSNCPGTGWNCLTASTPVALGPHLGSARNPAISKAGGDEERYLIVWEEDFGTHRDIYGRMISSYLTAFTSPIAVAADPLLDSFAPDVDGNGESWMVVYQQNETPLTAPADIFCARLEQTNDALSLTATGLPVAETPGIDERDPAISYLGTKYALAWSERVGPQNFDLVTTQVTGLSCEICDVKTVVASSAMSLGAEIGSQYGGNHDLELDPDEDRGMVVWTDVAVAPPFEGDISGLVVEAFGGGPITNLGGKCGTGSANTIFTIGPCALGNDRFAVATNQGLITPYLSLLSIMFTDSTLPCASCSIQSDVSSFINLGTGTGLSLPIPCNVSLAGTDLYFQFARALTGQNPCPLTPPGFDMIFSDRLKATIAP